MGLLGFLLLYTCDEIACGHICVKNVLPYVRTSKHLLLSLNVGYDCEHQYGTYVDCECSHPTSHKFACNMRILFSAALEASEGIDQNASRKL